MILQLTTDRRRRSMTQWRLHKKNAEGLEKESRRFPESVQTATKTRARPSKK